MSAISAKKTPKTYIEIETDGLSMAQIRALKTLNNMIAHILVTEDEGEFFEGSAEVMRTCASLIKQSEFSEALKSHDIAYADQAIEYSIDLLQEHMVNSRVVQYDN